MNDAVVTETRTEIRAEEVTETQYRCHVCEMVYERDDVLTVGVDRRPLENETLFGSGEEPRAERVLCQHCAEGLFDYDIETGGAFSEPRPGIQNDWVTRAAVHTVAGVFLMFPAIAAAAVIAATSGQIVAWPLIAAACVSIGLFAGVKL